MVVALPNNCQPLKDVYKVHFKNNWKTYNSSRLKTKQLEYTHTHTHTHIFPKLCDSDQVCLSHIPSAGAYRVLDSEFTTLASFSGSFTALVKAPFQQPYYMPFFVKVMVPTSNSSPTLTQSTTAEWSMICVHGLRIPWCFNFPPPQNRDEVQKRLCVRS